MSTLDTRKRVRVTTDHPLAIGTEDFKIVPVVLVDGEVLDGVTRVQLDASVGAPAAVTITLLGCDIDLEGAADRLVQVVGPRPRKDPE